MFSYPERYPVRPVLTLPCVLFPGPSEWSGRSISEVVSLLRREDSPLNWALFAPEANWSRARRTLRSRPEVPVEVEAPESPVKLETSVVLASPGAMSKSTAEGESPEAPKSPGPESPGAPESPETPESPEEEESPPTPRPLSFDLHSSGFVRLSGPLLKRSGATKQIIRRPFKMSFPTVQLLPVHFA